MQTSHQYSIISMHVYFITLTPPLRTMFATNSRSWLTTSVDSHGYKRVDSAQAYEGSQQYILNENQEQMRLPIVERNWVYYCYDNRRR